MVHDRAEPGGWLCGGIAVPRLFACAIGNAFWIPTEGFGSIRRTLCALSRSLWHRLEPRARWCDGIAVWLLVSVGAAHLATGPCPCHLQHRGGGTLVSGTNAV